jgi:RNA polymerase sigma-70 factor (TIGR02943 family)
MNPQLSEKEKNNIFENWVHCHYKELYTWARHKTGDSSLAEDLAQDTFLSAWKGYSNFKGDSNPKTWLFQILNHKIADHFRKSYKSVIKTTVSEAKLEVASLFNAFGNWESNGFEKKWDTPNLMDNEDFITHFGDCIGHLPDQWAKVIADKYLLGKKPAIICQENQISTTNYWQLIHRAKLMLKKCLEKFFVE